MSRSFSRTAYMTASIRECSCSFSRMLRTWFFTVFSLMNNRDIAKELRISENTVKNHVRNILEKLQLHSRMEAVVYAVREKILEIT